MMRIITGKARGVHLQTLPGEHTRPTSERAKEAIFSSLQFELRDRVVLDLFAGSGQMGLEALSRGAREAFFCDASREAVKVVEANLIKTRLALQGTVHCMDYARLLQSMRRKKSFDLVFLDPPYALGAIPKALKLLVDYSLLAPDAKVVCEAGGEEDVFMGDATLAASFRCLRKAKYGVAWVTLLQYCPAGEEAEA